MDGHIIKYKNKEELVVMLKQLNNMVRELGKGVSDERLEVIDSRFNGIDTEQLNNYETIAYNELSDRLWLAYTK